MHAVRYIKKMKPSTDEVGSEPQDMKVSLNTDPNLKKEFYEFAKKHFIVEALNFLDDVEQFKILYYEKATNWRKARFKIIVETYILPGANFEINISHAMRNKILKIYHENQQANGLEAFQSFDAATKEIEKNLNEGTWLDFLSFHFQNQNQQAQQNRISAGRVVNSNPMFAHSTL